MAKIDWSDSIQLHKETGLWYKFRQDKNNSWHILCSGDEASLEKDSVIYHDHYWQRNGHWYFQGKSREKHIIGRDQFLEYPPGEATDKKKKRHHTKAEVAEAHKKAEAAYGSSGYSASAKNIGIEVISFTDEGILNRFVLEFQELSTSSKESGEYSAEGQISQKYSSGSTYKNTPGGGNMSDSRLLLTGLLEYRNSLERHLENVTAEYQQVEIRWRAFNSVSEGDYAEQFRSGWMKTEARFKAYINQSQQIKILLNERITDLEALNKQESGLL